MSMPQTVGDCMRSIGGACSPLLDLLAKASQVVIDCGQVLLLGTGLEERYSCQLVSQETGRQGLTAVLMHWKRASADCLHFPIDCMSPVDAQQLSIALSWGAHMTVACAVRA